MVNKFDITHYIKYATILLVVLVSIILYWGYFAPLSTLAVASGKIIVSGQNKQVQHLEGGIVKKIFVKDGDKVKKDELLLKLDDTQLKAEYNIQIKKIIELKIKRDRLIAQKDDSKKIVYDKDVDGYNQERVKKLKEFQNSIFVSEKGLILSQIEIINKKIQELGEKLNGVGISIKNKKSYIESISEELEELQSLYDEQLIDKIELRELKRKKIILDGELSDLKIEQSSLKVNITQNEEEILKIKKEFITNVLNDLKELLSEIDSLNEQIIATKDKLEKTNIKSPLAGIVDDMQVFNVGGVLNNAQVIMSIVPKNSNLIIQANLNLTDIDTIMIGQKADITFSAFNTKMTFSIDGVVRYISADRKIDESTNLPYYQVDIEVSKDGHKQVIENDFKLKVGMPADVMIRTGSRTMLSYIIKPILDMKLRSFNEE
ncbi:MAG: HlyD family type I secretion periplasmic adaptor subunit [Campylobacterota bacterium]|nr:HlyD family type I secretion periplasmic adaptor subunit [Campylobacterota bacterium]